jgi:SNF2 family DNA or RNA helicase
MGLGKTHQAMALMLLLRERHGVKKPFLVICPRTVISHWRNKLRDHAPALEAVIYHGAQRNLDEALGQGGLLIASYGVLRNDAKKLRKVPWALVVFDEVQWIKNSETQGHQAAIALRADMKIGLTGTPIENSLDELKNLFDLILPGYLGDDESYFDRFGAGSRDAVDEEGLRALRRLVAPFVLRRLKRTVLDELPEKIEDTRTCSLSDEQRDLYRQTIATRGMALADRIRAKAEPLPYIHIFAVLNLLKQICDHPALALGTVGNWREHESRKWDLFTELLDESLGSGQKVVVFTQYLGMIRIMQEYLKGLGVEYATLTGSTRKRGEVVDRFNELPACRVFLGSLRAGGTGIDLVGGSVVIHYDRWWNAAKEDQATDRVYRIGQRRAVQVFKLLAENTLEERIAAMIDRKRQLLGDVVQADHPSLGKIFSPDELLELLQQIE